MKNIGIDLVEISSLKKHRPYIHSAFLKRAFFKTELDYCLSYKDPTPHLAGTIAAKEAVSKALGVSKFPWIKVEIQRLASGKPIAIMGTKKLKISISISHTKAFACAVALA